MKEIVLGIDIGGTNTELAWVSRDGNILSHKQIDTSAYDKFEYWLDKLSEAGDRKKRKNHAGSNSAALVD